MVLLSAFCRSDRIGHYWYVHVHAEKLWYVCQHSVGRIELDIIGTYEDLCPCSLILK